jgi:hypothetical protein
MLEEKISRLELALKVQRETHSESALLKTEKEIGRQVAGKSAMPRTCQDARSADPSLSSGMYWIDPDGQGVGDAPIQVYCDMASGKKKRATTQFDRNRNFFIRLVLKKGSTSVLHDSESPMDVGHCTDPGCYSRAVNYSATSRQMSALVELSSECHQSIKVSSKNSIK